MMSIRAIRYDVRATLSDVSQFEAPPGGYANRLDYLSPAEQRAEQLCEEERYFSLYNNDFEEELYKGTFDLEIVSLLINKFTKSLKKCYRGKSETINYWIWSNWI